MPNESVELVQKWILRQVRGMVKNGLVVDRVKRFVSGEIEQLEIPLTIRLNEEVRKAIRSAGSRLSEEQL